MLMPCGANFVGNLCLACRQLLKSLTAVNMRVNALETVVLCNRSTSSCKPGEPVGFRRSK
eukprot:6475304-Amphidinium_carterae.2